MKIGLVLAGGGGKGAYELGVWKALRELNLTKYISVFSGTSIGAFNSVLFAMDEMEKAEKLWEEVTMEKLVPVSKTELIKRGIGLYIGGKNLQLAKKFLTDKLEHGAISNDGAVEMVEKYLDFDKIKENGRICYAACTKLPNLNTKYFRINDYDNETAKKIVLASASLPLIYDSTEIFGEKYIDGGIADNVPIQPVYGEGCDIIIVVLLSKDVQIDRSLYPNSSLIIISPENLSENTITGTLNLDTAAKRIRIIEGYNDTINKIDPIIKLIKFVNKKEEEIKNPTLYKTYKYLKDIKIETEGRLVILTNYNNMLKEILKKDEIAAMKARDKARVSVLRLVNSEIKAYEVNNREDIPDENVIKIIEKSIKQTKEALEYAVKANNEEKIAEGKFALEVLTPYLPKQLTEEEVNAMLKEIITKGNYTAKDMGKIMKEIMPMVNGKFDRAKINPMVKNILS